jgi:hypothetical protein
MLMMTLILTLAPAFTELQPTRHISYSPVQVAPISLLGKTDPRLWAVVEHHRNCDAAFGGLLPSVRVASGFADDAVGNVLPGPSYAKALASA